ncbi:MAG: DUF4981 domain-containing protein [Oscillospiraceae bacterium]|nr:DUF4981 domain-containing protein [Oscillospiraceae bacterium]
MRVKHVLVLSLIVLAITLLFAGNAFAATTFTGGEWTSNSTTFAKGAENPRAHYYTYDSLQAALDGYTMYPEKDDNSYYMTLSDRRATNEGAWKFYYQVNPRFRMWPEAISGSANIVVSDFLKSTYDDSSWDNIGVPNSWQVNWITGTNTKKYDKITYKNTGWGWGNNEGTLTINGVSVNTSNGTMTNPNAPQNYNGVGTYRRHFTVPTSWDGRAITLNFDGCDGFYVWVNGVAVGYSEDTMARKEFDITDLVDTSPGNDNIIVVQVIRWVTGSWLEDQDFIRVSGIFRDIYLLARRPVDVYDFEIATTPTTAGNYSGNWNLSITAFLRDWGETATAGRDGTTVYASLYDSAGNQIGNTISSSSGNFSTITTGTGTTYTGWQIGQGFRNLSLPGARRTLNFTGLPVSPWSAETPTLYKLVLRVEDEYICIRVGFRYYNFTISSTVPGVFINGQRLLLHGTNAHEMSPYNGRALTEAEIREDLRIMKENNFNHIRMSHYPHSPLYYDIADEYGIYIMDESNIETHGNRNITASTNSTTWGQAIRDRMANMYERDKNYASVFSWSLGNESAGSGVVSYGKDWIKARDSLRPIHCEYENQGTSSRTDIGDMLSYMYDTASSWNNRNVGNRPNYLCEYSHGEGVSNGNYREYINVFETNTRAIGGAIWDWVDQSIWTPLSGTRAAQWPTVGYMAVGGDWGDTSNDGWFIGDGALFADRTPKPSMQELKYNNQMIRANYTSNTNTSVTYAVKNKNLFVNVNTFDMEWEVVENGVVILSGTSAQSVNPCPAPASGALKYTSTSFTTSFGAIPNPKPGAEYLFNLKYKLKNAALWAPAGYVIAQEQFILNITNTPAPEILPIIDEGMTVTGTGGNVSITGKDFSVTFSGGYISDYSYKGTQIMSSGPVPNFYRGITDNERAASVTTAWWSWWSQPSTYTNGNITVQSTDNDNLVIVTVPSTWSGKSLAVTTIYTIYPDGEIKVNERYAFSAAPTNSNEVPEVGAIMTIRPGFENLTWYGRGPMDAYVDRRIGVHAGIYSNTVADNFVYYQRAQEMGTKNDTRWLALTNNSGFGLMVKAGKFAANTLFSGSQSAGGTTSAYNASNYVEFNALHYLPTELSRSNNTSSSSDTSRHAYQVLDLHANDSSYSTYLRVNAGSTGAGGDNTWGARPLSMYRINISSARTVEYNFSLKPTDSFSATEASAFWTSTRNFYQNLRDLMVTSVAMGVPTSSVEYQTAASVTTATGEIATVNAYNALKELMDSIEPSITSFKIGDFSGYINDEAETITVSVPTGTNVSNVTPDIGLSMGTTLVTTGALNFTNPVQITVAGANSSKTYTVTVVVSAANEAKLYGFTLGKAVGVISGTDVAIMVPYGTNLTNVTPELFISAGSSFAPSGPVTFAAGVPFAFSITSANGSATATYNVTVSVAKSTECSILSFKVLDRDGQYVEGVFSGSNISVDLFPGTNLTDIIPLVSVSDGASYTPAGAQTFVVGTPVAYVVTADDGVTQRTYQVTIRNATLDLVKKVYAAFNTSGTTTGTTLTGLPDRVEVTTADGKTMLLPATWTVSGSTIFTTVTNASVSVAGQTISGIKVEVIKPGTVAFINCATDSSGSDVYDAVKELVGGRLVNSTSDRSSYGGTPAWGCTDGNSSRGTRTGSAYTSDKYEFGYYGNTNSTGVYYYYRITLDPGQYVCVAGYTEWWSGPRTTALTVRTGSASGTVIQTSTTAQVSSSTTRNICNNTNSPQSFTLSARTEVYIRFEATTAQAPDVSWIEIYQIANGTGNAIPELTSIHSVTGNTTFASELGAPTTGLPSTVDVRLLNGSTAAGNVVWNVPTGTFKIFSAVDVPGTVTSGSSSASITGKVEIVPPGLKYFIDCNPKLVERDPVGSSSASYDAIKALVPGLLNDTPDRAYNGVWGYTSSVGATGDMRPNDVLTLGPDKFNTGWYVRTTSTNITYKMSLEPGDFMLVMGTKEWWSSTNRTRNYTITARGSDGAVLATLTDSLVASSGNTTPSKMNALYISLAEADDITFTLTTASGSNTPQISWLAVVEQGPYQDISLTWGAPVKTANSITATAMVENYRRLATDIIIAIYDAAGRLVAVKTEQIPLSSLVGEQSAVSITISDVPIGAGYKAKAFVWDGSGTYVPLFEALSIE